MILKELLEKGGVVMPVILCLSVYVVAVIMYKFCQFWRTGAFASRFINDILEAVEQRKLAEAMNIAGNNRGPAARIIETAINLAGNRNIPDEKRTRLIEGAAITQIRPYESHLRGLEMVANIAPLLGLLGTVMGMVKVFAGISQTGSGVDPALLAGGIWEALIATVAGLAVAIPSLAAYHIVEGRIEYIRATSREAVMSIMARC